MNLLNDIDLRNLSNDSLTAFINQLMAEKERRDREEAEEDWAKVQNALGEYLTKYNCITIHDDYGTITMEYLGINTSEIGVIRCV